MEPTRAAVIGFSAPYIEIEATYLVQYESLSNSASDVDTVCLRIVNSKCSAYTLWLNGNLCAANLVETEEPGTEISWELLKKCEYDVVAGLLPFLFKKAENTPGVRVLDDRFTFIQQAIVTMHGDAAITYLNSFLADAKSSGLVASLLTKHGVNN